MMVMQVAPSWTAAALLVALVVAMNVSVGNADNLGCGGFVLPSSQVAATGVAKKKDLSFIEVKLVTADGLVKYSTECAPNGYYFIPLYDKGVYFFRIEGPEGWSFEPAMVPIDTSGDEPPCSETTDINFQFTGFSLNGRVLGAGDSPIEGDVAGPSGVTLTLSKPTDPSFSAETTSAADGAYSFGQLPPGKYSLTASHPLWKVEEGPKVVTVGFGNAEVESPVLVTGYDVTGSVASAGNPMHGVHVYLYADAAPSSPFCGGEKPGPGPLAGKKAACVALSNSDGLYTFPHVPAGQYVLVAHYQGDTAFDVSPSELKLKVGHGSTVVDEVFQVLGFAISGRVVDKNDGPVEGAAVIVDGQERARTGSDGTYTLDQITAGVYTLEALKEHVFFDPLVDISIMPNMAMLPPLVANSYHVCGRVVVDGPHANTRTIVLRSDDTAGTQMQRKTNSKGEYCFEVPPGEFAISAVVSSSEKDAGLVLMPPQQHITVSNAAVLDVDFSPASVRVSGTVQCLQPPCDTSLTFSLTAINRPSGTLTANLVQEENGDFFAFNMVTPGNYRLSAHHPDWCWQEKSMDIQVKTQDMEGITFVQSGYAVNAMLSHQLALTFAHTEGKADDTYIELTKGSNNFCLPQPGSYTISRSPCFKFDHDVYSYDTASPRVLDFEATHYLVTGKVRASLVGSEGVPSIVMHARQVSAPHVAVSAEGSDPVADHQMLLQTELKEKTDTEHVYEYTYWASLGEQLELQPSSSSLLFYPRKHTVAVSHSSCPPPVPDFDGRAGLILRGTVTPQMAGVEIVVSFPNGETALAVTTDADGRYVAGPLFDDHNYSVTASKEGYHFEAKEQYHFTALELGSLAVQLTDKNGNKLSAALVSLSGEGYRQNNATGITGSLLFENLFPGEYFVKPLLKEYKFDPPTQTITIESGQALQASFTGKRVAFSCLGLARSLNGEPEKFVAVQAVAANADGTPNPSGSYEETVSDAMGRFRIRGLAPDSLYLVSLKASEENARIERSSPKTVAVAVGHEDVEDLELIIFRRMTKVDLTGSVNASSYGGPLPALKVQIALASSPAVPIATTKLGAVNFFDFKGLSKDASYVIQLLPATPSPVQTFKSKPVSVDLSTFTPGSHVIIPLESTSRSDGPDVTSSSLFSLLFTIGLIAAAFNRKELEQLVRARMSSSKDEEASAPQKVKKPKQARR